VEMAYPNESTPILLLLVLAEQHMANALQEHLVAGGFTDHRAVHHRAMAHVTFEGIRVTELAERSGVTKQAMSELVADLVRLGYLQGTPDPNDGRAKLIQFTSRGRSAVKTAMEAFARMEADLAAALGPSGLETLRRSLLVLLDLPLGPSATDVIDMPLASRGRSRRRQRANR
jgi:DNA-binding MarR family transcriptional regulator